MRLYIILAMLMALLASCATGDDEERCPDDYSCPTGYTCTSYGECIPDPQPDPQPDPDPQPQPYCGDGSCSGTEDCASCALDCGDCSPVPGTVLVTNYSSSTITGVFMTPCTWSSWGSNLLSYHMYTYGTLTIYNVDPGCWDLRAESAYAYTEYYGMQMPSGGYFTWDIVDGVNELMSVVQQE